MTAPRAPAREAYDAVLDLGSHVGQKPTAFVLVKQTFTIEGGKCKPTAPKPLFHDLRDETLDPRLVPGTDFWPQKDATDVLVRGAACAPDGKPVDRMTVLASVGATEKRIAVFGRREIHWTENGAPRIGDPEPFTRIPLVYENAYGGVDPRVYPSGEVTLSQWFMAAIRTDHPGMYPRNPVGKGYLVAPDPLPGIELPNLEDPADLLASERLVARDSSQWYRQPLPASFDCVPLLSFPRYLFFGAGVDAWFPAPDDDRLPEVARGILPVGFQAARPDGVARRFFQDAPHDLVLPELQGGERVRIEGMHPEQRVIEFDLPGPPPTIEFDLEGCRVPAQARAQSVLIEPEAGEVTLVYRAEIDLHRTFIPGVHKFIPIAVSIDGDRPIAYEAPATLHDRLAAAAGG